MSIEKWATVEREAAVYKRLLGQKLLTTNYPPGASAPHLETVLRPYVVK